VPSLTPSPEPNQLPTAARERVIELLTRHFANDELTEAQLETRLQSVYAARTPSELAAIVSDLPSLAEAPRDDTLIKATLSGQERRLAGLVPKALQLRARMGYVELDLRNATFAPGITTIDVRALMGYVEIRLPVGVRVENHGSALIGYIAVKGIEEDSETIVRITGRAVCGYAEIFLPDIPADEED
jgi:hypothetical protein